MSWQPSVTLLDELLVAAVVADADGEIGYANAAARQLFGEVPTLVGSSLRDRLFAEADRGAAAEVTERVLSGAAWSG